MRRGLLIDAGLILVLSGRPEFHVVYLLKNEYEV
jgi:hypothetical protein